jgi:hypothetical protein
MSQYEKLAIQSVQAEDTLDLLNHIGWEGVIHPALSKYRNDLTTQITSKILGNQTASTASIEQLAGMIHGIDWMTKLFERILRDGKRASEILRESGISIDNSKP